MESSTIQAAIDQSAIRDILLKAASTITEEGVWCSRHWFKDLNGIEVDGEQRFPTGTEVPVQEMWKRVADNEKNLSLLAQLSRCAEGQVHLTTAQLGYASHYAFEAIRVADKLVKAKTNDWGSLIQFNDAQRFGSPDQAARNVADLLQEAADSLL